MKDLSCATFPSGLPEIDTLTDLALDLRWTWNHSADELWGRLDPDLWELTQNPWIILQTISREKLQSEWRDTQFRKRVDAILQERREAQGQTRWFQKAFPASPVKRIAYFSMEFMLSEALPIYSGGLGNVAGDQLKAADDLGVPVVGIGLLYQRGYFRQEIDAQGRQQALYPYNAPGQLPIRPVREANGEWLRLPVELPGLKVWIRTWQVQVGGTTLYLLDSNDPANPPAYRSITSELYGGGPETRIKQELILGIGGWRLLRAIGLDPEVCHLNEGHAAFAILERARTYMEDHRQPFEVALATTRAGNIFTTHTAVDAGFDRFTPQLVEKYCRRYAEKALAIPVGDLLALGRKNSKDNSEPFNMGYLALRGSASANGVSRLHGEVSRRLFQVLFPRWPEAEVPVGHVTNGIHTPTWECPSAREFWDRACCEGRWLTDTSNLEHEIRSATDADLWKVRAEARRALVEYTRKHVARQRATQGATSAEITAAERIFNFDTLTFGFARRFATYKRPNLLLQDPDRLTRILTNAERPVQLILAGKAHPQDEAGQEMIRQWNEFIIRPELHAHVVFLEDYDMLLTQQLVQGVDVWINTPRRPWEASGTSGMKILVNGGLNVSELDGWWAEAYVPDVGWAIGDGAEHGADEAWDRTEAEQLYDLIEHQIAPRFYARNPSGIPEGWVATMRESMARLAPHFSANRTVREYATGHYIPAATAYKARVSNATVTTNLTEWRHQLDVHWPNIRFGTTHVSSSPNEHVFQVELYLGELNPEYVQVEIYADGAGLENSVRKPMQRGGRLTGTAGGYLYEANVPAERPAADYTPRVIPAMHEAIIPLEAPYIVWQR